MPASLRGKVPSTYSHLRRDLDPSVSKQRVIRASIDHGKDYREYDSSDQCDGDQNLVVDVFIGHVETGEGGYKQADRHDEEEDLQRYGVVWLWGRYGSRGWNGGSGWRGARRC